MRTFENGNWENGDECPLCNTKEDGEVVLVPINGTIEGNIAEATQVHTKCMQDRWLFIPEHNAIVIK